MPDDEPAEEPTARQRARDRDRLHGVNQGEVDALLAELPAGT